MRSQSLLGYWRVAASLLSFALPAFAEPGGLVSRYPLNEVSGTTLHEVVAGRHASFQSSPGPSWANPGLTFDSGRQDVAQAFHLEAGFPIREHFTISAWVKSSHFTGSAFVFGEAFALGIGGNGRLWFRANDVPGEGSIGGGTWHANASVPTGEWRHVAVSNDGQYVRLYVDGTKDREIETRVRLPAAHHFDLWFGTDLVGGAPPFFDPTYFNGSIRDLRIYGRALTDAEAKGLAPALVDPGLTGLWVGEASLNEVKSVASGEWQPSSSALTKQLLMHVSTQGETSLLNEAILMRTRDVPSVPIVLSDPAQSSLYEGIVERGGKRIGQRFSCAALPWSTNPFAPTLSDGWLAASWTIGASDPTNPFRHKYHPDLALGRSIQHQLRLQLAEGDSPSDNTVAATLWESVEGLHKDTIETRGPITFTRVSTAGQLR